mmetsp:Transcript_5772/g.9187  ORF Transcript_5772/g.9187 Transcript_5772/m.9187 type:complete len:245 (-) Transcript_5772:36-770(-)
MQDNCFGGGKYCAETGDSKIKGHDIIMEDLRQMCIYKKAYGPKGKRTWFWDYVKTIHQECGSNLNEDCSRMAHKEVKGHLDFAETEQCVRDSFSTPDQRKWHDKNVTNDLIDQDIKYWAKYGQYINPSIMINNQSYRGEFETQAVFNALCAGFMEAPRACSPILGTIDLKEDLEVGIVEINDGYRAKHIVGVFVFFTFTLVVSLICYRRWAKRQMKNTMDDQVAQAITHYVALNQSERSSRKEN